MRLPTPSPRPTLSVRIADRICLWYFAAATVAMLTMGAAWGTVMLWQIGAAGFVTRPSVHEVNAHGYVQIMGWVGLFIMGFAYRALPRLWHTPLPAPWLATTVFGAMLVAMVMRTGSIWFHTGTHAQTIHAIGAVVQTLAVTVFIGQLTLTFRRSGQVFRPYAGFIFAAMGFMLIQSVFSGWHVAALLTAPDRPAMLEQLATWQAPLRDTQLFGMAMLMILGVGLRLFPTLFGLPEVSDRRAWAGLTVLVLAILLKAGLFIAFRITNSHTVAGTMLLPWLMLPIGVALVVLPWKLWRPMPEPGRSDRSAKFVRAAFLWLLIGFLLLLLMPVYQLISGIPFSHAYYGATRHAITVGFISIMIMGMGAKVIPTLLGLDPRQLTALWGPFLLVNAGCVLRVVLQTATDWHTGVFPLLSLSGALELAGLAWWAMHLATVAWVARTRSDAAQASRVPQSAT